VIVTQNVEESIIFIVFDVDELVLSANYNWTYNPISFGFQYRFSDVDVVSFGKLNVNVTCEVTSISVTPETCPTAMYVEIGASMSPITCIILRDSACPINSTLSI